MEFGIFDEVNAIEGMSPTAVYDAHLRQAENGWVRLEGDYVIVEGTC